MVTQGVADEFVIIDIAKDKVKADVQDLNHGTVHSPSPVDGKQVNTKTVKMQI